MTAPVGGTGPATPPVAGSAEARLRKATDAMEAMFYRQLLSAMRDATPESGLMEQSNGERMFTAMLDDEIATLAGGHGHGRLSEAMYRQLSARITSDATPIPVGGMDAAQR